MMASNGKVFPLFFNEDGIRSEEASYFASYGDIEVQRLMVKDKVRTETYRNSIIKNAHLFKGKVVMDIGAGTGILSLFMASAGAKKVYAVEASNLAKVIPEVAKDNNFGDIIHAIHSKVEDMVLPEGEKVDVIVSEWMGFYLLHESMLASVIFARDKFLANDGTMFPSDAKIYACPCTLESLYKEQFHFWENVWGFNMSAIRDLSFKSKQLSPQICEVKPSDLLADPICIKTFNLRYTTIEDITNFTCTNFVPVTKAGNYQGLALWFECDFNGVDYDTTGQEFGNCSSLSTSPFNEPTHWKQTVILLGGSIKKNIPKLEESCSGNPITTTSKASSLDSLFPCDMNLDEDASNADYENEQFIEEDEVIGWKLDFSNCPQNPRHYNISLEILDAEESEHPIPCGCPMPRCMIINKMIEKEELEENNRMEIEDL